MLWSCTTPCKLHVNLPLLSFTTYAMLCSWTRNPSTAHLAALPNPTAVLPLVSFRTTQRDERWEARKRSDPLHNVACHKLCHVDSLSIINSTDSFVTSHPHENWASTAFSSILAAITNSISRRQNDTVRHRQWYCCCKVATNQTLGAERLDPSFYPSQLWCSFSYRRGRSWEKRGTDHSFARTGYYCVAPPLLLLHCTLLSVGGGLLWNSLADFWCEQ